MPYLKPNPSDNDIYYACQGIMDANRSYNTIKNSMVTDRDYKFAKSVMEFYIRNRYVSPKQKEIIIKIFNKYFLDPVTGEYY